jgi:excisionase family DNA binding protein
MALAEIPGVYAIFCKATGLAYIGSSVNVHARTFQHISALRRHRHEAKKLLHAWKTYGENNFDIVILELCPKEVLFEREQFYIDAWDSFNEGYNGDAGPQKQNGKRPNPKGPVEKTPLSIDPLLTIPDVAKVTKIAPKTLYRLAAQGDIACIRIGRNIRFTKEMVESMTNGGKS